MLSEWGFRGHRWLVVVSEFCALTLSGQSMLVTGWAGKGMGIIPGPGNWSACGPQERGQGDPAPEGMWAESQTLSAHCLGGSLGPGAGGPSTK